MIEREVDLETADGTMNTFVTHPEEGGPHPAVLFYMDAPGKREELHDMARRIATAGYFVALPNLYYRRTREFQMRRDEAGMKEMFAMMRGCGRLLHERPLRLCGGRRLPGAFRRDGLHLRSRAGDGSRRLAASHGAADPG
jgi:hypothetical protein